MSDKSKCIAKTNSCAQIKLYIKFDCFGVIQTSIHLNRIITYEGGMVSNVFGMVSNELGMASNEIGMALNEVGMALNEVRMASNEVGMASNEVGMASDGLGMGLGGLELIHPTLFFYFHPYIFTE